MTMQGPKVEYRRAVGNTSTVYTTVQRFNDNVLMTFGTTDGTDADLSYNGSSLILRLNASAFEVHGNSGYGYVYIRDTVTGLTAGNGLRIGFNGGVARIQNYENTAMEFYNNGTKVWEFTNAGALKANGAKSITTSSGILTLAPAGITTALHAATTDGASLRAPHGTAPASPENGDIWTTTDGLYVHINGVTVGPLT